MSPGAALANDSTPLITSDSDYEIFSLSDVDAMCNDMKEKADATKGKRASLLGNMSHTERLPTPVSRRYESVGELMWGAGGAAYSDVRLTFEDRGVLAARTGIPSELRLHSIVLFESQFFREQLSCTLASPSSPISHMKREKQIIVRLPPRVSEDDLTCFYSTLKLMYTKAWDEEFDDNLAKAVGCLSVSCEIGFHEGVEACWRWLVKKCLRERNREMLRRLAEAYPDLHERFGVDTAPVEAASSQTSQSLRSESPYLAVPSPARRPSPKRPAAVVRRSSSRRKQRTAPHARRRTNNSNGKPSALANSTSANTSASASTSASTSTSTSTSTTVASTSAAAAAPMRRSNYSEESLSTNASASPVTRYERDLPSPTLGYFNDEEPSTTSTADETSYKTALAATELPSPMLSPVASPVRSRSTTPPAAHETVTVAFPVAPSTPPPTEFSSSRELNLWLRKFEAFSIAAKRACVSLPTQARLDSRCFPFLEHFTNVLSSIATLALRGHVKSQAALDMTLRMLNVIKVEHNHYHSLHLSPEHTPTEDVLAPPIVLHESLDAPLALILRHALTPSDQKHLIDYLWAPSNISNLMHLRAVRGRMSDVPSDGENGNDDMNVNEDEFSEMDEVMSEESLKRASRISQVEHMVVGERMAEAMREVRGRAYRMI